MLLHLVLEEVNPDYDVVLIFATDFPLCVKVL